MKVYNKGVRPIVYKRDLTGVDAIHPGKYLDFPNEQGIEIIEKFENACSEQDYKKHLEENTKESEVLNKKPSKNQIRK